MGGRGLLSLCPTSPPGSLSSRAAPSPRPGALARGTSSGFYPVHPVVCENSNNSHSVHLTLNSPQSSLPTQPKLTCSRNRKVTPG